jgi:hypothetical protein
MVTKQEYQNEVISFVSEYHNLCNPCGDCCSKLTIPLHRVELPVIARAFNDDDELRMYIKKNQYPFNIQSEYYFKIDHQCPFLKTDKCQIYLNRPLVCRLFPIQLNAFLDSPSNLFRDPLLLIVSGESHLPCIEDNILMNERFGIWFTKWGQTGAKIVDYVLAIVLDDASFGYLYGQEPIQGKFSFSPKMEKLNEKGALEYEFLNTLCKIYNQPSLLSVEVMDRLSELSDDELDGIRGRGSLIDAVKASTRLLKRMHKHKHPLLLWRNHMLSLFEVRLGN